MTFEIENLASLIERYGWEYSQLPDKRLISGFRGKSGHFKIIFQIVDNWLTITSPILIDKFPEIPSEKRESVFSYLLELNCSFQLIKYFILDNKIGVAGDIRIKNGTVDYDQFKICMDIVSEAVDFSFPRISELVTGVKFIGEGKNERE